MSEFKTKLEVTLVNQQAAQGRGMWKLDAPLIYQSDIANQTLTVPTGFITDLASVPRIPFVFLLVGDIASEAATLHDYLYSQVKPLSRAMADKVLKEAAQATGCPAWQSWLLYIGVRIGGKSHFGT